MADQARPQATEEQWWEDAARRLPPVAAVLVGAVWGAASQAVWAVLFLLAAWLLVVVLGSALPLRGPALGSWALTAAMLGSLRLLGLDGGHARLTGDERPAPRALAPGVEDAVVRLRRLRCPDGAGVTVHGASPQRIRSGRAGLRPVSVRPNTRCIRRHTALF